MKMKPFPELVMLNQEIYKNADVKQSSVFTGKSWGAGRESTHLEVTVAWKGKPENFKKIGCKNCVHNYGQIS